MKKVFALILVIAIMASTLVGCGGAGEKTVNLGEFKDVEFKFNEEADKYSDISDMPDWTGKQLDLILWFGTGMNAVQKNNIAKNDIVWPELNRVTGVNFSQESFDNNGDSQDGKISKVIAAGEWPHIIWGSQQNITERLIEEDMLWDLTDLIPEYMPHLNALMEQGDFLTSTREDGKIYEIDLYPTLTYAFPDMDPTILARNTYPVGDKGYVYVRDDILKMLKPEAYTQKELLESFKKNGSFTEEEIMNAAFNSKEEFYQFLRDVRALDLKDGNRTIYPTYAFNAGDNWNYFTVLAGMLNGFNTYQGLGGQNYFTYFDVENEKIEYMFKQDWYKEVVKEMTELVQEDVVSQDSLIDNRATFEEKCNNGQYAVIYGGDQTLVQTINQNSDKFQYRKVTINIPYNQNKFLPMKDTIGGSYKFAFMKNMIAAEDLPQVLRFFDFQLSDVGQKLVMWGPKSAGLFEEDETGKRVFIDKAVEDASLGRTNSDVLIDYGLQNKTWCPSPIPVNRWNPKFIYDFEPSEATMDKFYSTGMYEPVKAIHGIVPSVYNNFPNYIEGTKKFWDSRTAWENSFTRVLTAKNDGEFDELYANMIATAERNGLTDEVLEEINDIWVNTVNKAYMQNVYDHIEKVKK